MRAILQKYSFCREDLTARLHFKNQRVYGFKMEGTSALADTGRGTGTRVANLSGAGRGFIGPIPADTEPHEVERAGRFRFERLQRHFLAARGFLRYVLARYVDIGPGELRFSYNDYGKPSLAGDESLQFNISHSHEVGLVAVTRDAAVGVDVEHIRADFASEEIATRFFSRLEIETFSSLSREEQVAAFFRCWARKEAYIKAIGKGLSQPLDGLM